MLKIPVEEKFSLKGAVAPQFFGMVDGEISYFDKINRHEGRFYMQKGDSSHVLFEIGEEQGIVGAAGEKYVLSMGDKTIFSSVDCLGNTGKSIELQGVFFDFKINETGNYVCLGNINNQTVINILNPEGKELAVIKPANILFGSSIFLKGDYIYMGAIDLGDKFKLLKLNYLGNIIEAWDVAVNSDNRIISKIFLYEEFILMLIEGVNDSMVILDTRNSAIREIGVQSMGVKNIIDFNIYNDCIYLLNEKCINRYSMEKMICSEGRSVIGNTDKDPGGLYLKYSAYLFGLKEQIPSSYLEASIIYLCIFYYIHKAVSSFTGGLGLFLAEFYIFWLVHYTTAAVKNIFAIKKKDKRIEYLLEASGENNSPGPGIAAYTGIVVFSGASMIEFPVLEPVIPISLSMTAFILLLYINKLVSKIARESGKNLVIDLLWEENRQIKEYIDQILSNLKKMNSERLCIEITVNGHINERLMAVWSKSRENIIRETMIINIRENKIEAMMDLSKRDLKYSRVSIIMDYICFVRQRADIKEIQVLYPE